MEKLRTSNGKAQGFGFMNYIICISIFLITENLYHSFSPTILIFSFTCVWGDRRNERVCRVCICAKPTVSL